VDHLEQIRNIRDKVAKLIGKEKMVTEIPELAQQQISCHAVDVEFDRLERPARA